MSKIEWTNQTWNPTIGCDKVSQGCKNCYAIRMAYRLMHHPNQIVAAKYKGTVEKTKSGDLNWTGKINLLDDVLLKPVKNKKTTMYFVDSMSDLFHKDVPYSFVDKVFAIMLLCPQHTFQILTKRPDRMTAYMNSKTDDDAREIEEAAEIIVCEHPDLFYVMETYKTDEGKISYPSNTLLPYIKEAGWYSGITYTDCGEGGFEKDTEFIYEGNWPAKNIWLGVSVEDQKAADERIPLLLKTPAAIRFLSCEPLLGPLDISKFMVPEGVHHHPDNTLTGETGMALNKMVNMVNPELKKQLHWVIVGGESGPGARPMHPDWAREIRDQCKASGVAFFFKQWGEWTEHRATEAKELRSVSHNGFGQDMCRVGKHKAGRLLDGKIYNEYPKLK